MGEEEERRYALVTGVNKGLGYGICKRLASSGVLVVLTARNEASGLEAVERLKEFGLSDFLVFHQLDVTDPASVASLTNFIKTQFGKLDILVNNAGVAGGKISDSDAFIRKRNGANIDWNEVGHESYELAEQCVETNFYGTERITEALLPLLHLSTSPRIVNVTSRAGMLKNIPNEWARALLSDTERLNRERVDKVLKEFLKDYKERSSMIKRMASLCFRLYSVKSCYKCLYKNTGSLSVDEGAETPARLALLPDSGPSGLLFASDGVTPF